MLIVYYGWISVMKWILGIYKNIFLGCILVLLEKFRLNNLSKYYKCFLYMFLFDNY